MQRHRHHKWASARTARYLRRSSPLPLPPPSPSHCLSVCLFRLPQVSYASSSSLFVSLSRGALLRSILLPFQFVFRIANFQQTPLPLHLKHPLPSSHKLAHCALPMAAALGNFLQAHYTIYSYFSLPISHFPISHSPSPSPSHSNRNLEPCKLLCGNGKHRNKQSDKGNMLANILHGVEDCEHCCCPQ